jgi:hypothetical protein
MAHARDPVTNPWTTLTDELNELRATGRWLPGPATTLEVTGRSETEADHERLIAWLLDPRAAHYLGTALLEAMARRAQPADIPSHDELINAQVETQVTRATSRPDIVITITGRRTIVIELKIRSQERAGQTTRQADDYAADPGAVFIFLTLHGRAPSDERFRHVFLRDFAADFRQALESAQEPPSPSAERGRAVARDYLNTLERMLGMDPADHEAARFWLMHSKTLPEAERAARKLLANLPEHTTKALDSLAAGFDDDLTVVAFKYTVAGTTSTDENAVLLTRRSWVLPDGRARLGAGLGQSVTPDPDHKLKRPFWGIYAADKAVYSDRRTAWQPDSTQWDNWVCWKYLDLQPPDDPSDLLAHYAATVARHVQAAWEKNIRDLVIESPGVPKAVPDSPRDR